MRLKTPCPRCDTFIETEIDEEGYAVCPKCENSFYLPEYRAWKPIVREAVLKTKLASLTALIERLVEAGEKACSDYEGFGYSNGGLIKPKSLPLEFSQDEFEDIVAEWQEIKGGEA